ncbi:MAG: mRNA interferase MazF2 [Acidimicrobiaceae bacterium]|nr:mRNA interferase MazF2 [Acidimicrobiaceae bacterium]
MIRRGDVWWADLGEPAGSGPGRRRPVVVISADSFNRSRIGTVVVAIVTSNTALAAAPGNVELEASTVGLGKDSVVNVSQITTLDKRMLTERAGELSLAKLAEIDAGIRLSLALD